MNSDIFDIVESGRRKFSSFVQITYPGYELSLMHEQYLKVLNLFAEGKIRKLIVNMAPQHGKSELSTKRLPAFLIGRNPDLKIAITSYAMELARRFNQKIKQIMSTDIYEKLLFPGSRLPSRKDKYEQNKSNYFSVVGREGMVQVLGRGGVLTGESIDVLIMDDLYKNSKEAFSPVIRNEVISWYNTVANTRLHNNSQQLIVFTRWHQEDLVGYLEANSTVILLEKEEQLQELDNETWYKINFPAFKVGPPNYFDPRNDGEVFWEARHSKSKLIAQKTLDSETFESLYQGNPIPQEGLLYKYFLSYRRNDVDILAFPRYAYIDVADQGEDYLCMVVYALGDGKAYILDLVYTKEGQEVTEVLCAEMLNKYRVIEAYTEANAGGRNFARQVRNKVLPSVTVRDFTQRGNKESRILTTATTVSNSIYFPENWAHEFPDFYRHLRDFRKIFKANSHDDAADCLAGIVEKSLSSYNVAWGLV